MQGIIDFLNGLALNIEFCIDALRIFFDEVIYLVKLCLYFGGAMPYYFSFLPRTYIVMIGLIISVAVTYKILGREG